VLCQFIQSNRALLIDRCRGIVAARSGPKAVELETTHGIPVFIDQLIKTLATDDSRKATVSSYISGDIANDAASEIVAMATLHGRDLLAQGFTLEQVVRDYGDVCQAVTNLAFETGVPIAVDEFRMFNRCLDNAIAGAVTEYARHSAIAGEQAPKGFASRLGPLAHELRNYLHTATLVVTAIKQGKVGISGATGGVLDRSLLGMRNLIDRALAEVRVTEGAAPRMQALHLYSFLNEVKEAASFESEARGCQFTLAPVDRAITVSADPEMLAAAISNLLQNAFKFTQPHSHVKLRAHATNNRVLIEVEDHCGGLPPGAEEKLFTPFTQSGTDRSGLGLGLDICRRSVEANNGRLSARNVPGTGCVFTIDLPRLIAR
jgi:signal transduction histidine kinase